MTEHPIISYVLGFRFDGANVALIEKKRPLWQCGKYNGIGGHMALHEDITHAMCREFAEEAGMQTRPCEWTWVLTMTCPHVWKVYVLRSFGPLNGLRSMTDEPVRVFPIAALPSNVIGNLRWIIPFCLDRSGGICGVPEVWYGS